DENPIVSRQGADHSSTWGSHIPTYVSQQQVERLFLGSVGELHGDRTAGHPFRVDDSRLPDASPLGQDLADGVILRDTGDAPVADAELDLGKRRGACRQENQNGRSDLSDAHKASIRAPFAPWKPVGYRR